MEDEDGWGVVGMAIQGSCGHREREAVVRAIVTRWGSEAGLRQGRDNGKPPLWLLWVMLIDSWMDTIASRCYHIDTTPHFLSSY
jgi:hypothetical protein